MLRLLRLKSDGRDIRPFDELANSLRGLSGLIYPTEKKIEESLSYYQQREWRIIPYMAMSNKKKEGEGSEYQNIDRAIGKLEKDALLEIDANFFKKKLRFNSGLHRRVDKCRFFQGLDDNPLINSVRRIIVPGDYVKAVSRLMEEIEDSPAIVAIETL